MKSSITRQIAIGLLLLTAFFPGCVGQQSGGGGQQGSTAGKLYISNFGDGSLLTFGNAAAANGNQLPSGSVQNLNVQNFLLDPIAIFVDTVNDRLYVANTGLKQILVYNNASTITGNAVPDRIISGAATTLNAPRGLAVDTTNNILYVSDAGGNNILVFNISNFTGPSCSTGGPTTTCNLAPTQTITGLTQPWGLFLDSAHNLLYATNGGANSSVLVFNIASSNPTLARTITFNNTTTTLPLPRLSNPSAVFVDVAGNRLYVASNGDNAVLIFNNASSINGESVPDRVIDNTIIVSGTSTGSNTVTTLNDMTQSFIPNQFAGSFVTISGGKGVGQVQTITANTATQLTVSPGWSPALVPDATSTYQITISSQVNLSNPGGIFVDTTADILYVSSGNNAVMAFSNASTANRNVIPAIISGNATTLNSPNGLFVAANALYTANPGNNSIIVFNNASAATGNINIAPDRTISDAGAPLSFPGGIAVDPARNLLYAGESGSILIFDNASTLTPVPVTQTISVSPSLFFPYAIAVDSTRDRLYAASANSVLIFNNASVLTTGSPVPDDTISGLVGPVGLAVDPSRDLLYISELGTSSVKVYSQAGTFPTLSHTISGPALATLPRGLTVDTARDILYVCSGNSILVYVGASSADGSVTPNRTISGPATLLNNPLGLSVDSTHNVLYVANTSVNSILVFNNASTADGNVASSRTIAQGTDPVDETTLSFPIGISVDASR